MEQSRTEYVQVRVPDKLRLAELISDAKGPSRTMAQFADACGVSASTLSRIANGKMTKPLTEELVAAIIENNNGDRESFESRLRRANGMVEKDVYEARQSAMMMRSHEDRLNIENMVKNTLVSALLDRGAVIGRVSSDARGFSEFSFNGMSFRYDLSLRFFGDSVRYQTWNFTVPDHMNPQNNDMRSYRAIASRTVDRCAKLFLADAWRPEMFQGEKVSFVFVNEAIYRLFIQYLSEAKLTNAMSAILIDYEQETVVEETWLTPGHEDEPSIFLQPVIAETLPTDELIDESYHPDDEMSNTTATSPR